jgi:hypothetical protein
MNTLIAMLLTAPAMGWDLAESEPFALAPAPQAVRGLEGRERLLVLAQDALILVDLVEGELDRQPAAGGRALALQDLDGDGEVEVLVCGDQGLDAFALGASLGEPVPLTDSPCAAVAALGMGGEPRLATAGDGVGVWDLEGGLDQEPGVLLGESPLLAGRDGYLAMAAVGDTAFFELSEHGLGTVGAGGELAWLEARADGWVWALRDAPGIHSEHGRERQLRDAPERFWLGEVDGDGAEDLLVAYPSLGQLGLFSSLEGRERVLWLPEEPGPVDLVDLDGNDCLDVVISDAAAGTAVVHWSVDCSEQNDGDGDGWTIADGDCDDLDPAVHPAALELCNELDDDCDGRVDEVDVQLELSMSLSGEGSSWDQQSLSGWCAEGGTAILTATPTGCFENEPELEFWYGFSSREAHCRVVEGALRCDLMDDAEAELEVSVSKPGALIPYDEASCSLRIENVAPRIRWPSGCGSVEVDTAWREITISSGTSFSVQLAAVDPGQDQVTFAGSGGPPGLHVSSGGLVSWQGSEGDYGSYPLYLMVTDDDGGTRSYDVTLRIQEAEPWLDLDFSGCGEVDIGCCCGSSSGIFLPPMVLLWIRRRQALGV